MNYLSVLKKPKVYISLAIVLAVLAGWMLSGSKAPLFSGTFTAVKRDIAQKVSVTGRVKSVSDVSLAFEKSGRVSRVYHEVGTAVKPGEALVSLENADLYAQLQQTQANVKAQQAKLDALNAGSSAADLRIAEVYVINAKTALDDARRASVDALTAAQTNADDALHNKVDAFFSNPRTSTPQFNPQSDGQIRTSIQSERVGLDDVLITWKASLSQMSIDFEKVVFATYFADAKKQLALIKTEVDFIAEAVNALTAGTGLTQATIDGYKAVILAARTAILTQRAAITSAEQALRTAEATLALKQSQYDQAKAPARSEDIRAQEASVESASASEAAAYAALEKTILRSPIVGIVTAKNIEVGEIVPANTIAISVMSQGVYKIEATVAESDIANVRVGNKADVTLDAYQDARFDATVTAVDPAEVIIEGVPTYKVTLNFAKKDERIRSGMTANTDIITAEVSGAILVPSRSLYSKDGKRYVKLNDGKGGVVERVVEIGIKDGEGNTQIVSGVAEGEVVVTSSTQ
ncbi:MAG: efflux RND transporter periplasmic adaptor subunit [bacterium]